MIRLPTLHVKKLVKALLKAGFVEESQKGSHRLFFNPTTRRQTVVPDHGEDIKRGLMKKILKQAGLDEDDFRDLL